MNDQSDGLNREPRAKEPESNLIPGMAAIVRAEPQGRPPAGVEAMSGPNMPDTSGPGPWPSQEPATWVYDFDPATGTSRATFNGEVSFLTGGSATAGVTSWNGRTGAVALDEADLEAAGGAPIASPSFTGSPQAPTPAISDSSTAIATTAYVRQLVAANPVVGSFNGRTGAVTLNTSDIINAGGAPNISPQFTGTPSTPTAPVGNASGQIASTQFVANALASTVTAFNGRTGPVVLTLSDIQSAGGAPIASPSFTGAPSGPTAAPGTATGQLATTAFVVNAVTGATAGVASFNTRSGAVTLEASDVIGAGGAPIVSPVFTGQPEAPTPVAGDNSTKIATTAYVETALGAMAPMVASFNGRTGSVTLQLADVTSVGGAPLAAPVFTGSAASTTPPPGDSSQRIATTSFVGAAIGTAIAAIPPPPTPPAASTLTPAMNGAAAIGVDGGWSRGDHVHPVDTSRAAASALAGYLPLSGGTLTGDLTAPGLTSSGTIAFPGGYFSNSGGSSYFSNVAGGCNYGLSAGGDVTIAPAAGHNLLLSPGAGGQAGGGPWFAYSDERIKTVEGEYELGLDAVLALRPIVYRYRGNDAIMSGVSRIAMHSEAAANGKRFVGLIAQEAELVMPGMVEKMQGFIDGEAVDDLRSLNNGELIYALVNAVKTLTARIDALEGRG